MQTPAQSIVTYLQAKDGNRPHLMKRAFAASATLDIVVRTGTIAFPPHTAGLDAIEEVVVRNFARSYENVYTFCLSDPPGPEETAFSCPWLVGMSEKQGGAVRLGCGRYDWSFHPRSYLVERLTITIDRMNTLPAASLDPVMAWLSGLPYPWCPAPLVVASAPRLDGVLEIVAPIASISPARPPAPSPRPSRRS